MTVTDDDRQEPPPEFFAELDATEFYCMAHDLTLSLLKIVRDSFPQPDRIDPIIEDLETLEKRTDYTIDDLKQVAAKISDVMDILIDRWGLGKAPEIPRTCVSAAHFTVLAAVTLFGPAHFDGEEGVYLDPLP